MSSPQWKDNIVSFSEREAVDSPLVGMDQKVFSVLAVMVGTIACTCSSSTKKLIIACHDSSL